MKVPGPPQTSATMFSTQEREAIYRVISARRDVRRGFLPQPLSDVTMDRLLNAAHCAPSVGLMQPTRFVIVRSLQLRQEVHAAFHEANQQALATYTGERREQYAQLKLEGILEAPQNLCILHDPRTERGHGLGRHTVPATAVYSTVCAIQNLWLAARAEGIGVGWVSILDPARLRTILRIPQEIEPIAYLCLGYVESFGIVPELEQCGWEQRISLESVVSYETYQDHPDTSTKKTAGE